MKKIEVFKDSKYSFNIMPLLDVIFLLTIFYILTVTFQKEEKILPIQLPVSESPVLSEMESAILVEVDEFGSYYYDNRKMSDQQLEETITDIYSRYHKDVILIRSSESVNINRILRLTDMARQIGIEKVSIAVRELE